MGSLTRVSKEVRAISLLNKPDEEGLRELENQTMIAQKELMEQKKLFEYKKDLYKKILVITEQDINQDQKLLYDNLMSINTGSLNFTNI